MGEIRILIPKKDSIPSVYAEGVFLGKDFYKGDVEIILDSDYCTTVYYTYKLHRRLYVCCNPGKKGINATALPMVNQEVTILTQLRGRHFDRYKEAMSLLNKATKGQFYKLPPQFFWQLSILCRTGKNSNFNIKNLVRRYSPGILFEEISRKNQQKNEIAAETETTVER